MAKVVVVGGGWAGCGAAAAAAKLGMETVLLEKIDHLLGAGFMAGLTSTNAKYTAINEVKAMGAPEIFEADEAAILYRNPRVPSTENGYLYDIFKCERNVFNLLERMGVRVLLETRVVDVVVRGNRLEAVKTSQGEMIAGDSFVDATGSAGPEAACHKYGWGCVMCVFKCPAYGGRVSITEKAGVKEGMARRRDGGYGAVSNAIAFIRESIDRDFLARYATEDGCVLIPAPKEIGDPDLFRKIRTQQFYDSDDFNDRIVSVDNGTIKFMSRPWVNLPVLRRMEGFESVALYDPAAGGRGNAVRFLATAPWEPTLQVTERPNLFCCGEKLGMVGTTDATITGILAGHNAARATLGLPLLRMPRTTLIGESLAYVREKLQNPEGWYDKYSFLGTGGLGKRLKECGLYTTDLAVVKSRIAENNLSGVLGRLEQK
ncbi:MAG: FAD-dependent oxidoreductase [Firmicutes bacterium]|nr:FAD-dependent oxidoreductase [Bacillota bacterium]